MKMRKIIIALLILIIIACIGMICYKIIGSKIFIKEDNIKEKPVQIADNLDFNSKLIINTNQMEDNNYLISPYSIEIALSMLRDGANGESKDQIDKVIGNRKINYLSVKNRINVANAAFIKNEYKNNVKKSYSNKLKKAYNAQVLYDNFKTPDVINNWVKKETYGMIDKIMNEVDDDFVMTLANAVAIDVDWDKEFDCMMTKEEMFTKKDKSEMKVSMMHTTYNQKEFKYFVNDSEKGVVIPYKKSDKDGKDKYSSDVADNQLEFVGILPKNNIKDYVNNISKDKLEAIDKSLKESSEKTNIDFSLPMFKYDYDMTKGNKFVKVLKNMGIKDVFDGTVADLTNIIDKETANLYVDDAIHKTHIDLNEKGTKAAAVTAFPIVDGSALEPERPEIIKIKFNKPFIYIIRDSKTKEMLFFGVVYEPEKWTGSTCK